MKCIHSHKGTYYGNPWVVEMCKGSWSRTGRGRKGGIGRQYLSPCFASLLKPKPSCLSALLGDHTQRKNTVVWFQTMIVQVLGSGTLSHYSPCFFFDSFPPEPWLCLELIALAHAELPPWGVRVWAEHCSCPDAGSGLSYLAWDSTQHWKLGLSNFSTPTSFPVPGLA